MTRSRISYPISAGVACAGLAVALASGFAPRVVWNASASAPKGLYFIERRAPKRGEFALVSPRKEIAFFIENRAYLPPEARLIKHVAATEGDEVCRDGEAISINENHAAVALPADSIGRDMPRWSGCFTLGPGQFFLLNEHPKSLDGRYFGVTNADEIAGVARALWIHKSAP